MVTGAVVGKRAHDSGAERILLRKHVDAADDGLRLVGGLVVDRAGHTQDASLEPPPNPVPAVRRRMSDVVRAAHITGVCTLIGLVATTLIGLFQAHPPVNPVTNRHEHSRVWCLIFFNKNPGVRPAKNSGPSEDQCRLNELIDRLSQKLVRAASQRVRPVIPKENGKGVGVSPRGHGSSASVQRSR
jgi:hypothetical protein